MKRGIKQAGLFLVLGASINVAVAWACALWSPMEPVHITVQPVRYSAEHRGLVPWYWPEQCWNGPEVDVFGHASQGFGVRFSLLRWYVSHTPQNDIVACPAGWPFRALECRASLASSTANVASPSSWRWGVQAPAALSPRGMPNPRVGSPAFITPRPMPLRPDPLGLTLNTVLFASLIHTLATLTRRAREWIRCRRSLCPRCAYPLGLADLCPECGHPIRHLKPAP